MNHMEEQQAQFDIELDGALEDAWNQFIQEYVCTNQEKMNFVFQMWQDTADWTLADPWSHW